MIKKNSILATSCTRAKIVSQIHQIPFHIFFSPFFFRRPYDSGDGNERKELKTSRDFSLFSAFDLVNIKDEEQKEKKFFYILF